MRLGNTPLRPWLRSSAAPRLLSDALRASIWTRQVIEGGEEMFNVQLSSVIFGGAFGAASLTKHCAKRHHRWHMNIEHRTMNISSHLHRPSLQIEPTGETGCGQIRFDQRCRPAFLLQDCLRGAISAANRSFHCCGPSSLCPISGN